VHANKEHSRQDVNHFTIHHSDYTSGDNSSETPKKSLIWYDRLPTGVDVLGLTNANLYKNEGFSETDAYPDCVVGNWDYCGRQSKTDQLWAKQCLVHEQQQVISAAHVLEIKSAVHLDATSPNFALAIVVQSPQSGSQASPSPAGYHPHRYNTHSFRIGNATSAAEGGNLQVTIQ